MKELSGKFESIGDNCEFGFVQQHYQFEGGGLMRWALVGNADALINGIRTRFAGMFAFENLIPTGGGTMVFDRKAGIAFHTDMTSVEQGGRFVFAKSEAERREIHAEEAGKLAYLVDKFFVTLSEGQKILVFKQNRVIAPEVAQAILAAVGAYGDCSLLYVDPQQPGEVVGSVERVSERRYRGVIDRFAPYDRANDVSIEAWTEICMATAKLVAG
jgi:hypothetical protein